MSDAVYILLYVFQKRGIVLKLSKVIEVFLVLYVARQRCLTVLQ